MIQVMNTQLSNMIAAGEVVERPVSVVKELVENAIDAKATEIKIYVVQSGVEEIKVIDNGIGMSKEDALVCFYRHATSKIKTQYDLSRIHTLGFRGEALPSIASVSQVKLITDNGENGGFQVTYKGGICISKGEIAANKGTTVIVNNLFYNTPARLKFLKSLKKELALITYLLDKIALSNPEISFCLYSDEKEILKSSGNGDMQRLFGEIYGFQVAKNLYNKRYCGNGLTIDFYIVDPIVYRATKQDITIITNGRYVKNSKITNSIAEAYDTYLPIGKAPIALVCIEIDSLLIDVNVHPSKTEIKISNEDLLTDIIKENIKSMLEYYSKKTLVSVVSTDERKEYNKISIFDQPKNNTIDSTFENGFLKEEFSDAKKIEQTYSNYKENYVCDNKKQSSQKVIKEYIFNEEENKEGKIYPKLPYMEYVGQVHGTYLIFQNSDGMYLVDQHAAAERIRYEYYIKILGSDNQPTTELILPLNLEFTKSDVLYIEDNIDKIKNLGFLLESSGEQSFFVREVPLWAQNDDLEDLVRYILKLFIENKTVSIIMFRDYIAKRISCKGAIKANHRISIEEVQKLMEDLAKCNNPYHCPHGRPSIVKLTNLDLEKMFQRVL